MPPALVAPRRSSRTCEHLALRPALVAGAGEARQHPPHQERAEHDLDERDRHRKARRGRGDRGQALLAAKRSNSTPASTSRVPTPWGVRGSVATTMRMGMYVSILESNTVNGGDDVNANRCHADLKNRSGRRQVRFSQVVEWRAEGGKSCKHTRGVEGVRSNPDIQVLGRPDVPCAAKA